MNFLSIFRFLLASLLVLVALSASNTPTEARVSKKFLKGFLLGAYMAKHHEPIVIHMEKKHHG